MEGGVVEIKQQLRSYGEQIDDIQNGLYEISEKHFEGTGLHPRKQPPALFGRTQNLKEKLAGLEHRSNEIETLKAQLMGHLESTLIRDSLFLSNAMEALGIEEERHHIHHHQKAANLLKRWQLYRSNENVSKSNPRLSGHYSVGDKMSSTSPSAANKCAASKSPKRRSDTNCNKDNDHKNVGIYSNSCGNLTPSTAAVATSAATTSINKTSRLRSQTRKVSSNNKCTLQTHSQFAAGGNTCAAFRDTYDGQSEQGSRSAMRGRCHERSTDRLQSCHTPLHLTSPAARLRKATAATPDRSVTHKLELSAFSEKRRSTSKRVSAPEGETRHRRLVSNENFAISDSLNLSTSSGFKRSEIGQRGSKSRQLATSRRASRSSEFRLVTAKEFEAVPDLVKRRAKLDDVNVVYKYLWDATKLKIAAIEREQQVYTSRAALRRQECGRNDQAISGVSSRGFGGNGGFIYRRKIKEKIQISRKEFSHAKISVVGQTGEAKIHTLRYLKIVEIDRNGDVTLINRPAD